ncbi:antifreeze protein [Aquipluma nitroreducens]|uniref:Antifreeze protein n=2 Tax=Aquipluma nitroreducens TaxID=2010828 RepID=A0A5K7SH67_9BACT|nr:antifreeze protein [Aquipluma nitroreducens]
MRAMRERKNPKIRKNKVYFRIFGTALSIVLIAVFINGCTNEVLKDETVADPNLNVSIAETFPANQADTVVINPVIAVTFKSAASTSDVSASTLILKEGTIPVTGTVTTSGKTINFTPSTDLKPETDYTATIKSPKSSNHDSGEHSWSFRTGKHRQNNSLSVVSVTPLKSAIEVATNVKPTVTFNQEMTSSMTKLVTISLWQGTTAVIGTLTFSGKTATFSPTNALSAKLVYTGKVVFGTKSSSDDDDEDDDNNKSASTYTWSFTTVGSGPDVTLPTVLSVVPTNNASAIALNSKITVTFSEAMNSTTINTTSFTLKQGSTNVAGTVAYSGTSASFTPSSALAANTIYTGTITTGAKDAAGNAIASNYTWSFTTAPTAPVDVTPPTVISVLPTNNATNVGANTHPTVTFSEAMNTTTINTTSFTLKQGSTNVAGTVAYSGTSASFTPSSALAANTVYTGTITTGAKDAAGNAIASNYTWSFTTAPTAPVISFATEVLPILQSKCMPCHGATSPTAGISITNYTTVSKLSNSQIDNSSMYPKMGVTAAEQATIKAWIAAGRLNN